MNFCRKALGLLAAAALVAIMAVPASAQLTNAGFESGPLVDDGSGVGKWAPFSGDNFALATSVQDTTMPRSGSGHLALGLASIANSYAGVFQDVAISAGTPFTYSGYHKDLLGTNGAGIEIRVEYRDTPNDVEISRTSNLTPASLGTAYELFAISDVIPAGADTARVVYAIQSFGGPADQSIYVDDFSVAFVPEPTSLVLLGLGGLGLAATRRR